MEESRHHEPINYVTYSNDKLHMKLRNKNRTRTEQDKVNSADSASKSMVKLVRAEKLVLSGLVFARKIARMILIQNIQGLLGPLMINMAFMPLDM